MIGLKRRADWLWLALLLVLAGCQANSSSEKDENYLAERLHGQQPANADSGGVALLSDSVPNALVGRVEGTVSQKGITGGKVLSKGEAFAQGAVIETGAESGVELLLLDGGVVLLAQNSTRRLASLGGGTSDPGIQLELQAGHALVIHSGTLAHNVVYEIYLPGENGVIRQHPSSDGHLAVNTAFNPSTSAAVMTVLHGRGELTVGSQEALVLLAGQAGTWGDADLAPYGMLHHDFLVWLGALAFAEIDPAPFPVLAPYLEIDPAPFPVAEPAH